DSVIAQRSHLRDYTIQGRSPLVGREGEKAAAQQEVGGGAASLARDSLVDLCPDIRVSGVQATSQGRRLEGTVEHVQAACAIDGDEMARLRWGEPKPGTPRRAYRFERRQ